MYESPSLFEVAFLLLVRKFETQRALLGCLKDTQLIKRQDVMDNVSLIQSCLVDLDRQLSSFPVWAMGNFADDQLQGMANADTAEQSADQIKRTRLRAQEEERDRQCELTIGLLSQLNDTINAGGWKRLKQAYRYAQSAYTPDDAKSVPPSVYQDALRNAGVHVRIMRALR